MNTGNSDQNRRESKLYSIGEVSSMTGVKATVLRFWETEFEQLQPRKNKFGHRVYSNSDIEVIATIKHYLYDLGYTIKGARQIFGTPACEQGMQNTAVIKKIRNDLEQLLSMIQSESSNGS
jgi:DNA-binding transcriptional MerR regulator